LNVPAAVNCREKIPSVSSTGLFMT
jgi:hypothetical protein